MNGLRSSTFIGCIVLLWTASGWAAERPPNVIIIFCDDMGYADIGPFGAEGYQTPCLQRMAQEGRIFSDFHVGRSVCSPSRASLMTGCYPVRVGVPTNFHPLSKDGLNPDELTIAEVVKQQGYVTAMFGKWHLGHQPPYLPIQQGFDQWFGLPYSNDMWPHHPDPNYHFPDLPLMEGEAILNPAIDDEVQRSLTTLYTERTVKFIEENHQRPFLIYLAHAQPHVPLFVSDKFKGTTQRGLFGDVVAELDWSVGQILDAVQRSGIDEQTLVVFTSDNGPWLLYGDHGGSAGPLREGKGTSFEGGFRVPCIMRWPGTIPAGTRCSEFAATLDLLPTVAGIAGASLPSDRIIDGKDILPLMKGETGVRSPHEAFFYYAGRELQAVRSGKWKLVLPHNFSQPAEQGRGGLHGKNGSQPIGLSLFDLEADVGETVNLAIDQVDVVARLQALAETARLDLGDGKRIGPGVRER